MTAEGLCLLYTVGTKYLLLEESGKSVEHEGLCLSITIADAGMNLRYQETEMFSKLSVIHVIHCCFN